MLFLPVALATMFGADLTGRVIARLGHARLAVASLVGDTFTGFTDAFVVAAGAAAIIAAVLTPGRRRQAG